MYIQSYTREGFRVLPVEPRSKKELYLPPDFVHGVKSATDDAETLIAAIEDLPELPNIAVTPRRREILLDFDFPPRQNADITYAVMLALMGEPESILTQATGHGDGSFQILVPCPEGIRETRDCPVVTYLQYRLADLHYFVVEPSVTLHPYRVVKRATTGVNWMEALKDPKALHKVNFAIKEFARMRQEWPTNDRNNSAFKFLGQLWDEGFSLEECERFAKAVVAEFKDTKPGEQPYTLLEFEASVRSVTGRARRMPQGAAAEPEEATEDARDSTASVARTVAARLMDLVTGSDLFHDPAGRAYATFSVDRHQETYAVRSRKFRTWLARRYFETFDAVAASNPMNDALGVIEGHAIHKGPEREVYVRLAGHEGSIYLDLGDSDWTVLEINSKGWAVAANCPVTFRRERGMRGLPMPQHSGTAGIEPLWEFVNVAEADRVLVAAWLIAAFSPRGPYPVLSLVGEQGSAKSSTARTLRELVDPNAAPLRSGPRDERDLMIALNNGWVIALDNLSWLPDWLSDALCRISTGGGLATRELYSDADETIFEGQRPIVLTAIEDVVVRGDLLDRVVIVTLPTIPEDRRRPEAKMWRAFENARPVILGGLLDAVASALRGIDAVEIDRLPRMADFAIWAVAAETSMGFEAGTFLRAYHNNRRDVNDLAIDSSIVAPLIRDLVDDYESWEGTASDLLGELNRRASFEARRARSWPKSPKAIAGALRRLAPNLRRIAVEVEFLPRKGGRRPIRIEKIEARKAPGEPSPSSPPSREVPDPDDDHDADDDRDSPRDY